MDARCLILLCALCAGCCAAGNARTPAPPWKPDAAADVRPSLPAGTVVPTTPIVREPAAGSNTLARDVAEVRIRQAQMDNDLGRLIAMARQLEQTLGVPGAGKSIEGEGPIVVPDPSSSSGGPGIMGTVLDAAVGYGLPAALGAAGISFPPLLAFGLYKLLRGVGSRIFGRGTTSSTADAAKGAGASPSTFLAYAKRDGTEAHQLLELARLEGKNPILLGYQGLALMDELEELIRGDQAPRAPGELASALRAKIEQRVNAAVRPTETGVV